MSEDKTKKTGSDVNEQEQDMDTGYSWIILTGSFVVYMFVLGSIKCFGVLYTEMLDHFSAGSGNTAWIGSIAWFLLQGLAPLANVLTRRFSFRLVSFVGGIMVGSGYILSGFVNRIELMYITFTIVGIGYGLSYTASATIISFYFKERRALANGIVVSSGSIAVLSFPFLYRFLIDKYGLSRAFWIIGAILSNICVASCVFRQPKLLHNRNIRTIHSSDDDTVPEQEKPKQKCCSSLNLKFSLLKNPRFALLVIALTLCTIGHDNNYLLIPVHIKALGYSNTFVSVGVSIVGGVELIARIVIGWFADLNIIKKIHILVICTFIGGIFALMTPLFDSFTFMAVYAGVAAAFPASYIALMSVLAIERVGMVDFQQAFSVISVIMSPASMISLPLCGWLADYYGNWYPSFMFTGITLVCAGATAMLETLVIRFCMNKTCSLEKDERNSLKDKSTSLEIDDMELVCQEETTQCNSDNIKASMVKEKEQLGTENVNSNSINGNDNPAFKKD